MRWPGDDPPFGIAVLFGAVDAPPGRFAAASLVGEHHNQPVDIHGGKNQFALFTQPGFDQVAAIFVGSHAYIGPGDEHLITITPDICDPGRRIDKREL